VTEVPVHYSSPDEDSARWVGFPYRTGDLVVSTRSKHGTTWAQMICALLVFQTPDLPEPLATISPWLDWIGEPRDEVLARLEAQVHRRVIKTHTPLDGLPIDRRATYLVVARQPLDAAVSLYHQGANLDRGRMQQLTGAPVPTGDRPPLDAWLRAWISWDGDPHTHLDSLPGVVHHLGVAWSRRHEPNVVLVQYADLVADLEGEMRRLADRLEIEVPEDRWPTLVDAAGFERMRERADDLAPDPAGVLVDRAAFFRRGSSGAGREVLTDAELTRYHERLAQLAAPDLAAWLDRS
jgi:hypothetical protein